MRRFAVALLAFSLACGNDSVSEPTNSVAVVVVGNWSLESIGGATLPFLIDQAGADKLELMEATVAVTADGVFIASSTERTTISGVSESQTYSDAGRFTVSGNLITFTFDVDGSQVRANIDNDAMTFSEGTAPVIYRRKAK
jgi:hypothetical protein